mmetsp:Transcript_34123/g.90171  ORF Transcript_34123/g.90171 Transcript_34123/m.90171 type:complete len:531 (+) Transcript_34123:254-1846(+)
MSSSNSPANAAVNVKRSSRLAAKEKEHRENPEFKDFETDSRKRGRDKSETLSSIYKRSAPSSAKKLTPVASPAPEMDVQIPGSAQPRVRLKHSPAPTAAVVGAEIGVSSPSSVADGVLSTRETSGNGIVHTDIGRDDVNMPSQRTPNNTLVAKLKESQKAKAITPPPMPPVKPSPPVNFGSMRNRIPSAKASAAMEASREHSPSFRAAHVAVARTDLVPVEPKVVVPTPVLPPPPPPPPVPVAVPIPPGMAQPAAMQRERVINRQRGAQAGGFGVSCLSNADSEDLRRRLGGAVERWLSARSSLPGGEGDDLGGFRPEIERLVKLIAFDAFEIKQENEEVEGSRHGSNGVDGCGGAATSGLGNGDDSFEWCSSKEVTTTRFRIAHSELKAPFVFESTQHVFTGSMGLVPGEGVGADSGSAANGACLEQADSASHRPPRLEGLLWKVQFELIGFFVLAYHTQSYQVDEDVELLRLEEVREALQTHITSSELGVLFMLAGHAGLGPAAWKFVEDLCFWTANFSLPEFPGPSC